MDFDVFAFGALTGGNPGPVRAQAEVIGLAGWNTKDGFFTGTIAAIGAAFGLQETYIAGFQGAESINGGPAVAIHIGEGSIGGEIPWLGGVGVNVGYYITSDRTFGLFVGLEGGILGQYISGGVGGGFSF